MSRVSTRGVQTRRDGVPVCAPPRDGAGERGRLCDGLHGRCQGPMQSGPLPLFPPPSAPSSPH
ncbi:hypothetical protein E2986_11262 [Frieseomelitta varia]|uniref:Uncharacterized protein n=1 Tax=Frieseomelitta varia TaxID=561572 RepID=A0A833RPH4_9HYME|nr:hypothetical protein E2986_11262 [Frieseomelitta varia]